jgi:hypothetical protein
MPITPDPPYPKSPGNPIRSADWNQAIDEVMRLDDAKVNRTGDQVTGDLRVDGNLSVGTAPEAKLHVAGGNDDLNATEGDFKIGTADNRLKIGVNTANGDTRMRAVGTGNRLMLGGGDNDTLIVGTNRVEVRGDLTVPKTAGGDARFTNQPLSNEASLPVNNLKLIMGSTGLFTPLFQYEFMIGHTAFFFGIPPIGSQTNFVRRFAVNQDGDVFVGGDLTVSGSKAGYVVDYFINASGDAVEEGDVVVIGQQRESRCCGTNNNIPLPEVDLANQAADSRVCGIVVKVVTEQQLPLVETEPDLSPEEQAEIAAKIEAGEIKPGEKPVDQPPHPLKAFAGQAASEAERKKVGDKQMGQMVTHGCFAHCKVDADIAAIEAGDLLTTSPTKGHAQKVTDRPQAIGAILGKALAPLKEGKGKIPVLVTLQ